MQREFIQHADVTVIKYASRHWAVWLSGELVAVTVYRKGARRVAELLQTSSLEIDESSKLPLPSSHQAMTARHTITLMSYSVSDAGSKFMALKPFFDGTKSVRR